MTDTFRVGQLVELKEDRGTGIIRYLGSTSFSTGDWIGVEFDEPIGKNDGSVKGRRYFQCVADHGMFIRPTTVERVIEDSTPRADPPTAVRQPIARGTGANRAPGALSRAGSFDPTASRRQSVNAGSPTPRARGLPSHENNISTISDISTSGSSYNVSRDPSPNSSTEQISRRADATTRPTHFARHSSNISRASAASIRQRTSDATARLPRLGSTKTLTRPGTAGHGRGLSSASVTSSAGQADEDALQKEEVGSTRSALSDNDLSSHADSSLGESSHESVGGMDAGGVEETPQPLKSSSVDESHDELTLTQGLMGTNDYASVMKTEASTGMMGPPPPRKIQDTSVVDELENKLKALQLKYSVTRETLASLEEVKAERDRFGSLIQKLQAKYQRNQQEMTLLRRQLQESQSKLSEIEVTHGVHDTALEMATLDREMAEETAEALQTELDALKERAEELEEEVKVLREENEEYGKEMSTEERNSQGWLQLEKSNERLQEALIRLRDITQTQEVELKRKIADLQNELKSLHGMKEKYDSVQGKLHQSELAVEELRQQLDAALSAEDMIEDLTEHNLALTEQVDKLKLNIKDLEDLKELNDELERGHVEIEKQLQEELLYKDSLLSDTEKQIVHQDAKVEEHEYSIAKFRELVVQQQNHIRDLQSSKAITEAEAHELTSQSRVMADLNMKLQGSATKAQAKVVDIELRTFEAREAVEHLGIVDLFLPQSYKVEKDSVLAYLRFKRVAFKSRLLSGFLQEDARNLRSQNRVDDIAVLTAAIEKLATTSSTCDWIVYDIGGCLPETFTRYGVNYNDLELLERSLDQFIELWKTDQLKHAPIVDGYERWARILAHIMVLHDDNSKRCQASNTIMKVESILVKVENFTIVLDHAIKLLEQVVVSTSSVNDDQEASVVTSCLRQLEDIVLQARGAKYVTEKSLRSLKEFRGRNMLLQTTDVFDHADALVSNLVNVATLTVLMHLHANSEEGDDNYSLAVPSISALLDKMCSTSFPIPQTLPVLDMLASQMTLASSKFSQILSLSTSISQTVEFDRPPPPWTVLASSLQPKSSLSPEIAEELAHLKASLQARIAELHSRDRTLEEQTLKIELLESRMRDANAKAAKIQELELLLQRAVQRGEELAREIDARTNEVQRLNRDREQLKTALDDSDGSVFNGNAALQNVASAREVQALKLEINHLQGAVRQLRQASSRTRYSEAQMSWLSEPLFPKPAKAEKEAVDTMENEGLDLFQGLLDLVSGAKMVDLAATIPKDKLAWRPAREKSSWIVARQREEWERWKGRKEVFVGRVTRVGGI